MYRLNLSAWLILELCDGRTQQEIETVYEKLVKDKLGTENANESFLAGISALNRLKLIEACDSSTPAGG